MFSARPCGGRVSPKFDAKPHTQPCIHDPPNHATEAPFYHLPFINEDCTLQGKRCYVSKRKTGANEESDDARRTCLLADSTILILVTYFSIQHYP
jgi:hypothetical protein